MYDYSSLQIHRMTVKKENQMVSLNTKKDLKIKRALKNSL